MRVRMRAREFERSRVRARGGVRVQARVCIHINCEGIDIIHLACMTGIGNGIT